MDSHMLSLVLMYVPKNHDRFKIAAPAKIQRTEPSYDTVNRDWLPMLHMHGDVGLISPPVGPTAHWALDSRPDWGRPAR
jgi:hypothetical protein